jgi:hypothetical protein
MTGDNPLGRVNLDIAARLVEGLAAQECRRAKEALGPLFDTDTTSYPVGHLAELAVERIAELEQQLAVADAAATGGAT